jgi:two-component system nitrate/nitrite response regulator NarL
MNTTVRLIVANNHQLFRQCLATVLAAYRHFVVVDVAVDEQLPTHIKAHAADVVLIDWEAANEGLLRLTMKINEELPRVKLVFLGVPETRQAFLDSIEAGAQGYVVKEGSLDDLVKAIDSVLRDEAVCSPQLTHSLFERLADLYREVSRLRIPACSPLTFRQLQIVSLIANGLSNKQIARELRLSLYTVKNHIHNILDILDVEDRQQAVNRAHQNRWVSLKQA